MNRLKRIWDRRKIKKDSTQYTQGDIKKKLHNKFDGVRIIILDRTYRVPTTGVFQDILRENALEETKYQATYFDCESFSLLFQGLVALHYRINSVGVAISYQSEHAFNVVLTEDNGLTVWKLEPQADEMWQVEQPERDGYAIKGEIIII